jgi:hypothetical protein
VLWLYLAVGALLLIFIVRRNTEGQKFNGLDTMRELTERHRDLSRSIARERLRAKAMFGKEGAALSEQVAAMEQKRSELGESIQRLQAALVRRGFGVGGFWLPSVEEFEAEALAEEARAKVGGENSPRG